MEKVKRQNPVIKEKIENGSEFSIVYSKQPREGGSTNNYYQVVARVSNDIRQAIKQSDDKIYDKVQITTSYLRDNTYIFVKKIWKL